MTATNDTDRGAHAPSRAGCGALAETIFILTTNTHESTLIHLRKPRITRISRMGSVGVCCRWNALSSTRWLMPAASPPNICAFSDETAIAFRAVTDAKQRPGFQADPPLGTPDCAEGADKIRHRRLADQNFARSALECGDLAPLFTQPRMTAAFVPPLRATADQADEAAARLIRYNVKSLYRIGKRDPTW